MNTVHPVLLSIRGVGRQFAGVHALRDINLEVRGGEVLAIVGENGAGKSTLLKILSGVILPSAGQLEIVNPRGELVPRVLTGVRDAAKAGIALVHQELNLPENLDVAGSIFLGREPSFFGFMNLKLMHESARVWLNRVGLSIDPATPCGSLPIAQRQQVEIAKALSTGARILILDEPTSSLSAPEVNRLLEIIGELRAEGRAVIFVSHHLDEVMRIADRVVVLRDGRQTGELRHGHYDRATLERFMVGREVPKKDPAHFKAGSQAAQHAHAATVRLEVDRVKSQHLRTSAVSLRVHAGEIVALAGLVGAGRTELLEAIAGITAHEGSVKLDGRELSGSSVQRVRRGVCLVPEDRTRNGIFTEDSVRMNVSLGWIDRNSRLRTVNATRETGLVEQIMGHMQLRPPHAERRLQTLSGGNQQKTVIGRWIAVAPAVLLLDEPTRGVDVGARAEIHEEIRRVAQSGSAVLIASSEIEEVLLLADRVIVMHDGHVAGELSAQNATDFAIMHLATGGAGTEL